MTHFLNYNGKLYKEGELLISPNNRSFRYGDGCFETMKMVNSRIVLKTQHFERLFSSLTTLQFDIPKLLTADSLEQQITELTNKNRHTKLARVRLMFFRGDGGLYEIDNKPNYLIQTWVMPDSYNSLNENGLVMDVYRDARKTCDNFSPIKNNNYLCYAMAALWAKQQKLNDAVVLNAFDRVADATIANIFIIKDGVIQTPALTEGCINGVSRRYLLQCLRQEGMPVQEMQLTINDINQAQEMFLTNAAYGMRWVQRCGNASYITRAVPMLYRSFFEPLYR